MGLHPMATLIVDVSTDGTQAITHTHTKMNAYPPLLLFFVIIYLHSHIHTITHQKTHEHHLEGVTFPLCLPPPEAQAGFKGVGR